MQLNKSDTALDNTFAGFGKPFQERLAFLILDDPSFANQIGEVLDVDFFEIKYLKSFVREIYEFKNKYKIYPGKETIGSILQSKDKTDTINEQMLEFFNNFNSSGNSVNSDYVRQNAIEFCKKQKLKDAMIKSVELLKKSSFDEIRTLIDSAIKLGTNYDFGYSYDEHFEKRYEIHSRNPVGTGWKVINDLTRGGLAAGELGVVIAPTGARKINGSCSYWSSSFEGWKECSLLFSRIG